MPCCCFQTSHAPSVVPSASRTRPSQPLGSTESMYTLCILYNYRSVCDCCCCTSPVPNIFTVPLLRLFTVMETGFENSRDLLPHIRIDPRPPPKMKTFPGLERKSPIEKRPSINFSYTYVLVTATATVTARREKEDRQRTTRVRKVTQQGGEKLWGLNV